MAQIYVYVDGSDLGDVESVLLPGFENFAKTWDVESVRVINDKYPRTADLGPEGLPDWNLGINFESESLPVSKIEQLMVFLSEISAESNREFVIGAWNPQAMISNDWCFVGKDPRQSCIDFLKEQLK